MNFDNLTSLYQYFDNLAEQDVDADILFASSYLRGFIALSAADIGDEQQVLTRQLAETVTQQLVDAKAELTPQDQVIVNNYWQNLLPAFSH